MRRNAKAFAMPAEELAFARCVAAAAGYIAGPGEMSPDLEYALMRQLSMLSKGDEDLEAELMEASRTEGSLWREMCFFQNDHERVSAFLSILREIVRGDQMASEEEKGRFCSAAEQLGCPEEEAHRLLRPAVWQKSTASCRLQKKHRFPFYFQLHTLRHRQQRENTACDKNLTANRQAPRAFRGNILRTSS